MTIITNADADLRIDPAVRGRLEQEAQMQGLHQDEAEIGKRNARDRIREIEVRLPGADSPIKIDGEEYVTAAPSFVLDEPDVDATVETLMADHVIQLVHKEWWPFKPKGRTFGLFPVMGPKGWEAVLDTGTHCMRCLRQHDGMESFPEECGNCGLTADYRARVLEMLEAMKELSEDAYYGERQGAAKNAKSYRTKSGLVLPGGKW